MTTPDERRERPSAPVAPPHLRLHRAARGRGRHPVPGRVRRAGDPDRGPGAPGHAGTSCAASRPSSTSGAASTSAGRSTTTTSRSSASRINLRSERGKELLRRAGRDVRRRHRELRRRRARAARVLVRRAARDHARHRLRVELGLRPRGPYASFKTWGPIVQAVCGLTFTLGLPDLPPAGWGYSYMDHMGGNFMAIAILAALVHRNRTGEGQWIDMSCTEAGVTLIGPALLDFTVNGRPAATRRACPTANRSRSRRWRRTASTQPAGDDELGGHRVPRRRRSGGARGADRRAVGARRRRYATLADRLARRGRARRARRGVDRRTRPLRDRRGDLQARGVPGGGRGAPGGPHRPRSRPRASGGCGRPRTTARWATCASTGCRCTCRDTDWAITRGAPCLGEHNDEVLREVLGSARRRDRRARAPKV